MIPEVPFCFLSAENDTTHAEPQVLFALFLRLAVAFTIHERRDNL